MVDTANEPRWRGGQLAGRVVAAFHRRSQDWIEASQVGDDAG
jgi:hypothetical protein